MVVVRFELSLCIFYRFVLAGRVSVSPSAPTSQTGPPQSVEVWTEKENVSYEHLVTITLY